METVFPSGYYTEVAVPALSALLGNLNNLMGRCNFPAEKRREALGAFERPMKRDDFDVLLRPPMPDIERASAEYVKLHETVGRACQAIERVLDGYHFGHSQNAYERTSMRTLAALKSPAEFEAMLHEYEARHCPRPPIDSGA